MRTQDLITIASTYSAHVGLKLSTIGAYSVNDGKFFDRLGAGGSCTLRTARRVFDYLSDNWPADLEWPRDIPRPKPSKNKEAA